MTFDPDKNIVQIHPKTLFPEPCYSRDQFGLEKISFRESTKSPPLPIDGYPCPDYPIEYYFLQNSNKLRCYDEDEYESKKEILLPFKIETGFGIEKPKIKIDKINSFITYLNQSTFDVYISSNIQEGKYEKHKSKFFLVLNAYL